MAIIVAVRIELRNLYLKCQRGLLEIPQDEEIVSDWFFRQVLEAVPLQLRRNYHVNNSNSSSHYRHRKKSSGGSPDEQVTFVLDEIRSCLTFENEEIEFHQASRIELQMFLFQSVKLIDSKLLRELNEVIILSLPIRIASLITVFDFRLRQSSLIRFLMELFHVRIG